jgi:hypothetical protein
MTSLSTHQPPRSRLLAPLTAVLALAASALAIAPAHAADIDVGVSIGFSQPGVYGRIDIGTYPQPQVIVAQPVIIQRPSRLPPPVYLWVPPGHQKDWKKHCGQYNACGVPVYFVQDRWYQEKVVRGGHPSDKGKGGDKGQGKGNGKGHGESQGKGKGKDD